MATFLKLTQLSIFLFLALSSIVRPIIINSPQYIEVEIERLARELSKNKQVKGLAFSVVKDDRTVMSKGFGYKNSETQEKVDERTLFGIAGLTNAFAAATLVKILTNNNITLNTPLRKYVDITFPSDQLNKYVTLEDLLAHRTGLAKNNFIRFNPNFTRGTLNNFLKHFDTLQDFRSGFVSNNIMYGLASFITEILSTGETWEDVVTTQLLKPLGMNDTTFSTTVDINQTNIAYAHLTSDEGELLPVPPEFTKKWAELGGSGAILSSANDMARWMRFFLNKGELDGQRIMTSENMEDIQKNRNYVNSGSKTFIRPNFPITISRELYSLGWRKGYYRGVPIITNTGSTWGYKAMLTLFPEHKLGIFNVLSGTDDDLVIRRHLHFCIADLYLGEPPWSYGYTACTFPWDSTKKKKRPYVKRDTFPSCFWDRKYDFAGIYSNQLWGNLQIETTATGLQLIYGYASFSMIPTSNPLQFDADGLDDLWFFNLYAVKFETESGTNIASVTIPSFQRTGPPTFYKES